MTHIWDAIVVGAGPAGSSLAARLGAAGRSVLLVDSARFPRDKMCGEYLGAGCLPLVDEIGALDGVLRHGHVGRFVTVCSPGGVVFTARYPEGLSSVSLRRAELDAILLQCARRSKTVEVREGFRGEKLLIEDDQVRGVKGRAPGGEEETLRARVVIGADGRNSMVARSLRVFRWHPWRRRFALGLHYGGVQPAGEGAEIYVGRSLYGILNHQRNGAANVNLVLRDDGVDRWKGRLDAWFDSLLAELPPLRERLASARPVESVRALGPLAHYSTRVSAGGALLVGDAAGFYDPFTGEGVHMALESARLASEVIGRSIDARRLSARFLRQYDAARAESLRSRYRLQSLIQAIVGCPHLMDFAARRLQSGERLANRLLEVTGGLRRPGALLPYNVA